MAYIGKNPTTGSFLYADDISTSSTNTYNITVGGVAFSPQESSHVICSLNGVIQKGGGNNPSFTISGSQITFLPSSGTLSSSDSIDFILILGSVNDVGVATTVTDSAITKSKLNLISDSSSAGLTVKGDGSSENGTIQLNCSQNSHGVKISSPAHSAGQSYELILPTGNVTADKVLKVASVSGSGTTGIGQLSFADAGGSLTPYFYAYRANSLSVSHATYTTIVYDTEEHDTGSGFNTSTGQYTVPEAGKYYFEYQIRSSANGNSNSVRIFTRGERTGSATTTWNFGALDFRNNYGEGGSVGGRTILTCAANDVIYTTIYHQTVNSQNVIISDGSTRPTYFLGFKIAD